MLSQTMVFTAHKILTWVAAGLLTGLHDLSGSGVPAFRLCDALLVPTYHQRFLDSWHHHHQFVPGQHEPCPPLQHATLHGHSSYVKQSKIKAHCGQAQWCGCSTHVGCCLLVSPHMLARSCNLSAQQKEASSLLACMQLCCMLGTCSLQRCR